MTIKTSLIVAMAENRCIGKKNRMPWHISDDLKRFKALTMGHPVIMGRRTFESILGYLKGPLPDRESIILTKKTQPLYTDSTAHQANSIEDAIKLGQGIAKEKGLNEVFIIGGAQVYAQSFVHAHRIHLTKVHREIDGDAFFPIIEKADWEEVEQEDRVEHDPPYSFITLERRQYLL